jgi:AraC-like DNA-binding protein
LIINYFISPHPSLQLYVDSYILCTSGGEKVTLKGSWAASNETSLIFYMADRPSLKTSEDKVSQLQSERGCIIGLQPQCNGVVSFTGVYHTFIIQFKANGFYKLFRMPMTEVTNKIHCLDDLFGVKAKNINEQLRNAGDIQQMAHFADVFLLFFLNKQKAHINLYDGITFISNELFNNASLLSIEQYAYKANMSVRNFGRRFIEQTGVPPKLYCRLLRFNNAINKKLKQPQINWTSITYDCGYYDQMHMIKDFKEFANVNPSALFEKNTEFTRPRIDVAGSGADVSVELNNNLFNEKFVTVKRIAF